MSHRITVQPTIEDVRSLVDSFEGQSPQPNRIPLYTSITAEFLTPSSIYLKVKAQSQSKLSFLFESAATSETIGRYSFVGADPRKVFKTGPGHGQEVDPLPLLEKELAETRLASVPSLSLPILRGGAIGYVGYDCVKYFEPRTKRPLKDVLQLPESMFMFYDTVVAFDHFFQVVKVITYLPVPSSPSELEPAYQAGVETLARMVKVLNSKETPLPPQGPVKLGQPESSNIGKVGYQSHVNTLKKHICRGDIIQAVPSQRLSRPTDLHPFNIYRHLRTVNPSPYLFYVECEDFQIIGASPELLVKSDTAGRIINHPIAGTVKRGKTSEEDKILAAELSASLKDRAEHVMLVDLARNDVNRVCDPLTTRVEKLMVVQKFSHVQHLVSEVSGTLRAGQSRFDAFRSIFPAGTVSGAPKVRAMELIAELEKEKRGVYAGAVGWWGYDEVAKQKDGNIVQIPGEMDTCIALRTMVTKGGIAYLQAGGGIVFDSDPEEEYIETLNKLGANIQCIKKAEEKHYSEQNEMTNEDKVQSTASASANGGRSSHIDLAGGV